MKKILKCISAFIFMFAFIVSVKASTNPAEAFGTHKITLKSIPLTKEYERDWYTGNILSMKSEWEDYDITVDSTDIYKGTLIRFSDSEEDEVTITYEYDSNAKKVADSIMADLGEGPFEFALNDIEALTYMWSAKKYIAADPSKEGLEPGYPFEVSAFSSDFKKKMKYNNFEFDIGAGGGTLFENSFEGELVFIYNDTFYGMIEPNGMGGTATISILNCIYVPEGTTDYVKAIKDRVSKYFNVSSVTASTKVVNSSTVAYTAKDYLIFNAQEMWRLNHNDTGSAFSYYPTVELYVSSMFGEDSATSYWEQYWENHHEDPDFINKFGPQSKENKSYFVSHMASGEALDALPDGVTITTLMYDIILKDGTTLKVFTVEDTEKSKDDRKVKTTDASTGIQVDSEGVIPFDTLLHVARITSGDEYDNIVKILKNNNVDMFDLKLITKSNNELITKLDNGKFKVSLPIKEEFQNKALKVYYVTDEGKVETYDVTISEDGKYATFETNHFSIYTLAESGKTNPKTGDNLVLYLLVLTASGYALYTARNFN